MAGERADRLDGCAGNGEQTQVHGHNYVGHDLECIVKAEQIVRDVESTDDLQGQEVCSVTGSTSIERVNAEGMKGVGFDSYSECVQKVLDGTVPAMSTDGAILAAPGWAAAPPSGLHLSYGSDPGREMVVSWSTPASVRNPRLLFGSARGQYGTAVAVESVPSPGLGTVQHHARLTGLTPDSDYFYQAAHDGRLP
jgi:hypothetical protein